MIMDMPSSYDDDDPDVLVSSHEIYMNDVVPFASLEEMHTIMVRRVATLNLELPQGIDFIYAPNGLWYDTIEFDCDDDGHDDYGHVGQGHYITVTWKHRKSAERIASDKNRLVQMAKADVERQERQLRDAHKHLKDIER